MILPLFSAIKGFNIGMQYLCSVDVQVWILENYMHLNLGTAMYCSLSTLVFEFTNKNKLHIIKIKIT